MGRVVETVRASIESLRQVVAGLDPSALDGAEAKRLVEDFSELERLASAGRTLAAGRVAETGGWADGFRDAAAWMSSVSGTTVGRARATLETAERLAELPKTDAALRAGGLSEAQVDAIASAASADPDAEPQLLACAARNGVRGLKNECARVEAAASTDQDRRYESVRVRRFIRHRALSDVEGLLEMRGPIDRTAAVMAALEPYERELFEQARKDDRRELPETLAFDAMVEMAGDVAAGRYADARSRAPATLVFRVDKPAFDRGETEPGELCEVAGVGPVPVSVAQRLSSDAILKSLITDGVDVQAVSHLGRTIPTRLRTAIEELYPECAIAGCNVDRHLETDHNIPVADGGPTAMWNLQRLCHYHHDLKHAHNLRTVGEGTNRRFVPADEAPRPPPDP